MRLPVPPQGQPETVAAVLLVVTDALKPAILYTADGDGPAFAAEPLEVGPAARRQAEAAGRVDAAGQPEPAPVVLVLGLPVPGQGGQVQAGRAEQPPVAGRVRIRIDLQVGALAAA